jgi:hypothetical protein
MIVLMATVILGIAIAAMVIGLQDSAQDITDQTTENLYAELGLE